MLVFEARSSGDGLERGAKQAGRPLPKLCSLWGAGTSPSGWHRRVENGIWRPWDVGQFRGFPHLSLVSPRFWGSGEFGGHRPSGGVRTKKRPPEALSHRRGGRFLLLYLPFCAPVTRKHPMTSGWSVPVCWKVSCLLRGLSPRGSLHIEGEMARKARRVGG